MVRALSEESFKHFLSYQFAGKTVALVGSSARLSEKAKGSLIDEHDCVIRFNDASTLGNETIAGSRTTHRFLLANMNARYQKFLESFSKGSENSVVITKTANVDFLAKHSIDADVALDFPIHRRSITVYDALVGDTLGKQGLRSPRSGFATLCYLAQTEGIGAISVFGVDNQYTETGNVHYFTNHRRFENSLRNYERFHMPIKTEISALNMLLNHMAQRISFH